MDLIKRIILAAGVWENNESLSAEMEQEFERLLGELQHSEDIEREDAIQLVMKEFA